MQSRLAEIVGSTAKLVLVAASLLVASAVSADSIGLNFVDTNDSHVQNGQSDSLAPGESAGAPGYQQIYWNNLGRWGQTVALHDNTGAPTGVTTTWDSNNTWRNDAGSGTPDNKLMHGYLDATGQANWETDPYQFFWNENKPEAYVTGLGAWLSAQSAPRYNVIVYIDGDTTEGRIGEYWLQAPAGSNDPPNGLGGDLTSHLFVRDVTNFSGTYKRVHGTANSVGAARNGNYVVFSDLTADSFILRTEEQTYRAQINGLQIVAVPEPGSLFCSAACGLSLVAASGRRRLT